MLVLSRQRDETIMIGDGISIEVLRVDNADVLAQPREAQRPLQAVVVAVGGRNAAGAGLARRDPRDDLGAKHLRERHVLRRRSGDLHAHAAA